MKQKIKILELNKLDLIDYKIIIEFKKFKDFLWYLTPPKIDKDYNIVLFKYDNFIYSFLDNGRIIKCISPK